MFFVLTTYKTAENHASLEQFLSYLRCCLEAAVLSLAQKNSSIPIIDC